MLERLRSRRKSHAVTGLIAFFAINFLVGLPVSLLPHNLILNLVVSAVFGLPIGYLISISGGGALRGGLISMAALMAARIILGIPDLLNDVPFNDVVASGCGFGLLGLIPGILIGVHVSIDD